MIRKQLLMALAVAGCFFTAHGYSKTKNMKIKQSQAAPDFSVKDVNGNQVNLSAYRGKKVLLSFHRFAGCPICNLRFHQLEEAAPIFEAKGLVILGVYESSQETMKEFIGNEQFHSVLIADPDSYLYNLYDVERSKGKLMKGMFNGAMGKMKEGKKLYKTKVKNDGHVDRVGADFIIDEQGKVIAAYYGQYVGDNIPIDSIKALLR